ncbi:endonuclease domain-containing protein [Polaribacter sp.]|nr:endonuclease domain-containing protein [Polaribacter sp.]
MKLNNEKVKKRLRDIFGNEYDLSKVNYINKIEKIILVCKKHGEFSARLSAFTKRKQRCQDCKRDEQLEVYLKFLKSNYPYITYSLGQSYTNSKDKFRFVCKSHGVFEQTWNTITRGTHCPKCGANRLRGKQNNRIIPIEEIISRVYEISQGKIKIMNPEEYENSHSKLKFECTKGHTWSVKLYTILQGKGCAKCAGLRITTEDFIINLKEIHGDTIGLVEGQKYKNRKDKIRFKCKVKNHPEFTAAPSNIIFRKSGCPECKKDTLRQAFSYTTDEIYNKIEKKFEGRIIALPNQIYENQHTKWVMKCQDHSHPTWETSIGSVLNTDYKYGCRYCMGEKPVNSYEEIENLIKTNFDGKIKLTKVHGERFLKSSKITVFCSEHKKTHTEKLNNILKSYGCPDCSEENQRRNRRTDEETLLRQVFETHREFITIVNPEEYVNTETRIKFLCHKKRHGVFEATPHSIISGNGCPICKMSKGERKILFWLRDENINHKYQFRVKKHKGLGHFIFDFLLTEKNIIIEYDGRQHFMAVEAWGGEEAFKKNQKIDKLKDEFARLKGWRMLRIHYKDFKKIEEILQKSSLK